MTDLRLRTAAAADAEVVFRMLRDLAHDLDQVEDFTATLDDVRRDAFGRSRRYEAVLAEVDKRPAGLATFFPIYSTYKGRPCLYLDNLFVEHWARGLRVGRALMGHVCRVAAARGCCRVELKVLQDNPARGFYEAIGMEPSPERPYLIQAEAMRRLIEEA